MIGLVVTLLLAATPALADDAASPLTVRATAVPDTTTIGSRVRYEVTVTAPAGLELVEVQPAERIGDLDIVDFGVEPPAPTKDGRVVSRRWWTLVAWSPGHHLLPSPAVRYRTADGTLVDGPKDDLGLTVESLLEKATPTADIRDIKPPEPIPVDWRPYYWLGGTVLALLAILLAAVRWLRRSQGEAAGAPPPPPDVVARAALDALRARGLVEQGAFKEYYSALSDIVRRYLEDRFEVRAPEMTTEEFLTSTAREGRLAPAHRRLLGEFLAESDLVKFARHVPALADATRAFDAAQRFVEDTAPREHVAA